MDEEKSTSGESEKIRDGDGDDEDDMTVVIAVTASMFLLITTIIVIVICCYKRYKTKRNGPSRITVLR